LYHHKTDGGAEYLCTSPVEGTDEGDLYSAIVRLDGEPELVRPIVSPEFLKVLTNLLEDVEYAQPQIKPGLIGNIQIRKARALVDELTSGG
jgi:hypothetical protein